MPKKVTITPSFFPAAEHLLPRLSISARQHEELRAFASRAARDTVREGPTWGRSNVDAALARGWRILSAKPTSCLLIKKHKASSSSPTVGAGAAPPTAADKKMSVAGASPGGLAASAAPGASAAALAAASSGQSFMAHSVLPHSLEDIMNTQYNENTSEMRAATRRVYGDYLLDCCVLQTLEGATMEDPFWYLGLKWLAIKSPIGKLVASREFVILEHSGSHIDPMTGERLLFRILQSVHVRGYGGQDSYFGLTRGHIETAFVYWMEPMASGGEMLHVCMKGRIHPKGSLPLGILYKYIKKFWRSEQSIFTLNDSTSASASSAEDTDAANGGKKKKKRRKSKVRKERVVLEGAPLEMASVWVPDDARPRCAVCRKKFHVLRRAKHHCRACGEVICKGCTFYHVLNVRDRKALARQTMPRSTSVTTDAMAAASELRRTNTSHGECDLPRHTMPTVMSDRESTLADVAAEERSLAMLDDDSAANAINGQVVAVVTGKVCHRCIHGKSIIVATTQSAARKHSMSSSAASTVRTNGSAKNLFATHSSSTLTSQIDEIDEEIANTYLNNGPDGPRSSRRNYEHVSAGQLSVWMPNAKQMNVRRLGDRNTQTQVNVDVVQHPRLTEDLPMILADVETGSIAGFDESKTFIESVARPSTLGGEGDAREPQPEPEQVIEGDEGEESDDEDDESSVAESSVSSTSSSLTSSQLRHLMDTDGSSSATTPSSKFRGRRNTIDELVASSHSGSVGGADVDADMDVEDFEFYPAYAATTAGSSTLTLTSELVSAQPPSGAGDSEFAVWGFDPDCLFELKDEDENEDDTGSVDGLRSLDSEDLGVVSQSTADKTASVLAALTQVESTLADQAQMLAQLQHEQAKGATFTSRP